MNKFYSKIKKICEENNKVAMFIDMDGTIVEYTVYPDSKFSTLTEGTFLNAEPLNIVIENLKKISKIENLDLYILSLSKNSVIKEEKKKWLNKYVDFIDEENWIIINKEKGEYNKDNRDRIKCDKMKEKIMQYDYEILLDDDHKILKQTQQDLGEKCSVFHITSAII